MKREERDNGEAVAEVDALLDDFDEDIRQMVQAVGQGGAGNQRAPA